MGQFCVLALLSFLTFSAPQPQQNPTMFHWQVEQQSHGTTPYETAHGAVTLVSL